MSADSVSSWLISASGALLLLSAVFASVRALRGPSAADRVVALDLLGLLGVSLAGFTVFARNTTLFLDVAIGVALIGFLTTVAFAAFLERGSERSAP